MHNVRTNQVNIKDQKKLVQQIKMENMSTLREAEITYTGWLTRSDAKKQASSLVMEFTRPEDANKAIEEGLIMGAEIYNCELYDRSCRLKRCFRCQKYGHSGTQCDSSNTCGFCAEQHDTRECTIKNSSTANPKCALCKGEHSAWSSTCPTRKREKAKVEQAKRNRPYLHHTSKTPNLPLQVLTTDALCSPTI
jgi:hypothetical protein